MGFFKTQDIIHIQVGEHGTIISKLKITGISIIVNSC
jgi:hypothetical protein